MPAEKVEIVTDNGTKVKAIAPVIVSASRSTDIPLTFRNGSYQDLTAAEATLNGSIRSIKSRFTFLSKKPKLSSFGARILNLLFLIFRSSMRPVFITIFNSR